MRPDLRRQRALEPELPRAGKVFAGNVRTLKPRALKAETQGLPMLFRVALFAVLLLPSTTGCAAVAAAGVVGVGLVQYQRNEAEQDFPTDLQETWKATLEGLRRLAIEPVETTLGATEGRLVHEGLQVLVERHPEGFTRVRVRFNTFHTSDNERRARLVLKEIEASIEAQDALRAWVERVQAQSAEPPSKPAPPAPEPPGS